MARWSRLTRRCVVVFGKDCIDVAGVYAAIEVSDCSPRDRILSGAVTREVRTEDLPGPGSSVWNRERARERTVEMRHHTELEPATHVYIPTEG